MNKRHIINIKTGREKYFEARENYIIHSDDKMRDSWVDLVKLTNKNEKETFHIKVQRNNQGSGCSYSPALTEKAKNFLIKKANHEGVQDFIKYANLIFVNDIDLGFETYSNKEDY